MNKIFKKFAAGTVLLSAVFLGAAQAGESVPENAKPEERYGTKQVQDLTSHPLAGSKVKVKAGVRDAAGQTGESEDVEVTLPERDFKNPIAPVLAKMRRDLATDTRNAPDVLTRLYDLVQEWQEKVMSEKALSELKKIHEGMAVSENEAVQEQAKELAKLIHEQENSIIKPATLNRLERVHQNLAAAQDVKALEGVVSDLWSIMLQLEEDVLTEAEKKLRDAEDALREALENGATPEEIEKLVKEAQEALEKFLEEQAEDAAAKDDAEAQKDYESMKEMLEKMKELMEELGLKDDPNMAQDLQEMLENMQQMSDQVGQQNMTPEQMREMMKQQMQQMQQQMEQMQQMQKSMKELQELIKEQQELMDKTAQESKKNQQDLVEIEKALKEYADSLKGKIKEQKEVKESKGEELARQQEEQENATTPPTKQEAEALQKEIDENEEDHSRLGFFDRTIDHQLDRLKTAKEQNGEITEDLADSVLTVLGRIQEQLEELAQQDQENKQEQGQKNDQGQQGQQQGGQSQQGGQQSGQQGGQSQQGGQQETAPEDGDVAEQIKKMLEALEKLGQNQQGLQEKLDKIQEELRQKRINPGKLKEANSKMDDAKRQLNNGQAGKAVSSQNEALDALREGMQQMQQQLQQMQGQKSMGSGVNSGQDGKKIKDKIDPSGRGNANDDVGVDPSDQENTVRPIRDIIRENLENPDLPDEQREYLEGLLKKMGVESQKSDRAPAKPVPIGKAPSAPSL